MIFIKNYKGEWWELNIHDMSVSNFNGGFHNITQQELESSETLECDGWSDLYKIKKYCPLQVDIKQPYVWISPDGLFYDGDAHENRAEEILEIIYRQTDVPWTGDRLEELGWIRATTSLMWEVRLDSDYWEGKRVTQEQYDALWEWCKGHNKTFPKGLDVV